MSLLSKSMSRDDAESLADDAYQRGFLAGFEAARKAAEARLRQAPQFFLNSEDLEFLASEISDLKPT